LETFPNENVEDISVWNCWRHFRTKMLKTFPRMKMLKTFRMREGLVRIPTLHKSPVCGASTW